MTRNESAQIILQRRRSNAARQGSEVDEHLKTHLEAIIKGEKYYAHEKSKGQARGVLGMLMRNNTAATK
jgi:hypothetical protein